MDRVTIPDVLTLEEASGYLRLSVETVAGLALKGNIPGRKIENDWRFLKSAIPQSGRYANDDWLRAKNSSSVLLAQAGVFIEPIQTEAEMQNGEPRTTQKCDRDGNVYYQVYDPRTQDSATFGSESEIRWWIEQHYSR